MKDFKNVIKVLKKQKDDLNLKAMKTNNIYVYEDTLKLVVEYIGAIDILENLNQFELKQKSKLNSLYGYIASESMKKQEKYTDIDIFLTLKDTKQGSIDAKFRNVNVEIKEKFIQVYNGVRYFNYNINEVIFYELRESKEREYCEKDIKITKDYLESEVE